MSFPLAAYLCRLGLDAALAAAPPSVLGRHVLPPAIFADLCAAAARAALDERDAAAAVGATSAGAAVGALGGHVGGLAAGHEPA